MIRRTVAVTVRVVVEASNEGLFNKALQSHRVEVEPEKKRGKK